MGFFKRALKDKVSQVKQDYYANRQISKKSHAEYLREKEKHSMREAGQRAKIETDERLKQYKEKKKSPGYTFKGFAGPTQSKPNTALGVADYLTGSGSSKSGSPNPMLNDIFPGNKAAKPRRKRRKKRSKGNTVTIRMR